MILRYYLLIRECKNIIVEIPNQVPLAIPFGKDEKEEEKKYGLLLLILAIMFAITLLVAFLERKYAIFFVFIIMIIIPLGLAYLILKIFK